MLKRIPVLLFDNVDPTLNIKWGDQDNGALTALTATKTVDQDQDQVIVKQSSCQC